jgi:UDP-2,3-diacylglucosamine pyrophosphatase LpxH
MKLAFVSDTHFGDEMCTLVDHSSLQPGPKFDAFSRAAGTGNDFLVLLGDIFDFSIAPYEHAYPRAKFFFQLIKKRGIAKNIIYVPGNHDFDMWQTVQQQIRVIYQVRLGRAAQQAHWSVPGLLDDRSHSSTRGFLLPGVIEEPVDVHKRPRGEKLFLNSITREPGDGANKDINFYVAYPNLYMVTDEQSLIATHGHYMEVFWTLSGEWIKKVCQLRNVDLVEDIAALNSPLCQLACTGLGQAGQLTTVIHRIQRQVKDGELDEVKRYIDRLDDALDELTQVKGLDVAGRLREIATDAISNTVKNKLIRELETRDETRYSQQFARNPEVLERFKRFYRASWKEIQQLNRDFGFAIEQPREIIFGHTHRPIPWEDENAPKTTVVGNKAVRLYNTGGWLWKKNHDGRKEFCGAEVFTYETSSGFSSTTVT